MCRVCEMAPQLGDAAPRMHVCQDTGKAVSAFEDINFILTKYTIELEVPDGIVHHLAYDLLVHKREEYQKDNMIYYCEDLFANDLTEYLDGYVEKKRAREERRNNPPPDDTTPLTKEEINDEANYILIISSVLFIIIFVLYLIFKN